MAAPAAEPNITVSELVSIVTARLATDRSDRRIAKLVASVQLQERLEQPVIAVLGELGAGPATLEALEALAGESASLPRPTEEPVSRVPAPSDSEQAALASAARGWSAAYLASLPDFTCRRAVHQFRAESAKPKTPSEHWRIAGSNSGEAAYVRGHDYYRATAVDGQPFRGSLERLHRDRSWGEFGGLMLEIMDPSREATLQWDRWEVLYGRRMAVFRYAVDQKHARYWLISDVGSLSWMVTMGHRGFIYVNPQTGSIGRLVLYGNDIPPASPIQAAGDVVDYADVSIAGNQVVLPVRAVSYQFTEIIEKKRKRIKETREEIEFSNYRKFESNSTITFDTK